MSSLTKFPFSILVSLILTLGMDRPGWSDDSKESKSVENSIGMKLMRIPKGKFAMGSERTSSLRVGCRTSRAMPRVTRLRREVRVFIGGSQGSGGECLFHL